MSFAEEKMSPLAAAIWATECEAAKHMETLEIAAEDWGKDADSSLWQVQKALRLLGCLRRLVDGSNPHEIHKAFGAPGDFGYDTLVGQALSDVYRKRGEG